jgi:hypothetical protein
MTDPTSAHLPREDAGKAAAQDGVVILDGPDGVAVTMTADAAARTADSLQEAAGQARAQRDTGDGSDTEDVKKEPGG